jgi:hypothetical protein
MKITRALLMAFMAAILIAALFACLKKPTVVPSPGGQVIVKQSGDAVSLIAECTDKSYITQAADYIIKGTVEKVESQWNQERTGFSPILSCLSQNM